MTRLAPLLWREIESLFFSPLAYIVLTIFLLLSGFSFDYALTASAGDVEETVALFLGNSLLFWLCLVIIPALVTMRLVAEERRSGLLEVLLTAPVRDGEVILAKYLGAMVFQAFLWAPTLLYIVIIRNYGALPDAGQILTSYVGIACVTSLLTAVGLLFSTRTSNQMVAAIGSLTVNLVLLIVPIQLSELPASHPGRLLESISMVAHFGGSFSRGLLDTAVLAWYVAATIGVLVIATRSLEARRWR